MWWGGGSEETILQVTCEWPYAQSYENGDFEIMSVIKSYYTPQTIWLTDKDLTSCDISGASESSISIDTQTKKYHFNYATIKYATILGKFIYCISFY
jgi:hypothetical protein